MNVDDAGSAPSPHTASIEQKTRAFSGLLSASASNGGSATSVIGAGAGELNFQTLQRRMDPDVNSKLELTRVKVRVSVLTSSFNALFSHG